ncbi:GNAT family N-acetyltransferase [Nocardia crassostreae]|uniref:GNAT family N-acetyltransferase n=1 Tax=Nocardia crassostreae TaxID=53428 RepID=UPI000AD61F89|nr:GNAT family N-acetyltransferase [Nocardia crassostreae]
MTNSEIVSEPVLEAGLDEERLAFLEERLDEYNSRHSPVLRRLNQLPEQGDEPVQVYLVREGRMIGGLTGRTWADWLVIDMFWVDEEYRGTGLGGRLLTAAEDIARERGCTRAHRDLGFPGAQVLSRPRLPHCRRDSRFPARSGRVHPRQGHRLTGASRGAHTPAPVGRQTLDV